MASSFCSSSSLSPHLLDECWETVLKRLDDPLDHETLSLVSRKFLSLTNGLRTSLNVTDRLIPLLPALLRRFPNLTSITVTPSFTGDLNALLTQIASSDLSSLHSLSFSQRPTFPSTGLRDFALKFPTLKSLDCSRIRKVAPTDLELIGTCFPNLEELDLTLWEARDQLDENMEAVFAGPVEAMASGLQKLRKVSLGLSFLVRGPFLLIFCRKCESLEELSLGYLPDDLDQNAIADVIRLRPGLRSLTVDILGSENWLMSSVLIHALLSLKSLTCLNLSKMALSDVLFCGLADAGVPLRELNLRDCSGFSKSGLSYLLSKCNLLQNLDLGSVELTVPLEDPFVEWSLFLPNLISLTLGHCGNLNVTELTFFAVVQNCPLITKISMLISECPLSTKEVDEGSLMSLPVNCHVKILSLICSDALNDESVKMIASVCPNLEEIDLSLCGGITDRAALEVLKMCPKIRSLDVGYSGVAEFVVDFQVPALFRLNLSGLEISDETLSAISKNCCWLKYLNLESCNEITDKGVKKVVENCKQLRMMDLMSCEKVSADVVSWMVLASPSLRMLGPPPSFHLTDSHAELDLHYGCHLYSRMLFFRRI
ncbi:hypothetical protein PIB30_041384 [Stylosanthes scabra]|uniref:F-box/LRR-repeat protein 15-like leucin rich repeat domain-containing protein n=1 Tax=Stylosanthes scabra TaxID=79078 RepID=A0ABU6QEB0_9FABA|nr:hypothetical protein [Stylosanthes scabra]